MTEVEYEHGGCAVGSAGLFVDAVPPCPPIRPANAGNRAVDRRADGIVKRAPALQRRILPS